MWVFALVALFSVATSAAFADGIEPGLWKITAQTKSEGMVSPPHESAKCLTADETRDLATTFSPVPRTHQFGMRADRAHARRRAAQLAPGLQGSAQCGIDRCIQLRQRASLHRDSAHPGRHGGADDRLAGYARGAVDVGLSVAVPAGSTGLRRAVRGSLHGLWHCLLHDPKTALDDVSERLHLVVGDASRRVLIDGAAYASFRGRC